MPLNRKIGVVAGKLLAKARRLQRFWQQQVEIDSQIQALRHAGADPELANKVILITGSSKGIGLTLAKAFFQRGAHVVINGRDQQAIDQALTWFQSRDSKRIVGIQDNIAVETDAEHLINQTISHFGRVDVLINSAGVTGPFQKRAWEIENQDWRQTFSVNLDGAFYCSKHFMRWAVANKAPGRIIHISSGAATAGMPYLAAYATSKAALESLIRNLAADAEGTGVMVCGIELGSTQSSMTRKFFPLETYLQLPLPESHIPVFLYAATADCGQVHGRTLASWRFNAKGSDEGWLAASMVFGGKLEFKPRQIPSHLIKNEVEFLELAENQFGPSPAVQYFLDHSTRSYPVSEYPDLNYNTLRDTLAERMQLSPSQFSFGNGSSELVERLLRIFVHSGESVVSNDPSWFVFDRFCAMYGINNLKVPFQSCPDFRFNHNLGGILNALKADTRLIYLVHPSNPVGVPILHDEFIEFISRVPQHIPVIVDEAYLEYADHNRNDIFSTLDIIKNHSHPVIGLRTFSKIYGLAGMRIGYAYASPSMIQLLEKLELPFNVSALAAECARIALSDNEYIEQSRNNLYTEKKRIENFLKKMNLDYVPTQTSLMLAQFPTNTADEFYQKLKTAGVLLAPVSHYEKYFLWPIALPRQNNKIMRVIENILHPAKQDDFSVLST